MTGAKASLAYLEYCTSIMDTMPADAFTTTRGTIDVDLSLTERGETCDLLEALENRRSNRTFSGDEIPFADISAVLDESFRYREHDREAYEKSGMATPTKRRSSPSGGSLQSCEAYLIAKRISGLASGVYHYQSHRRNLGRVRDLPEGFNFGALWADRCLRRI